MGTDAPAPDTRSIADLRERLESEREALAAELAQLTGDGDNDDPSAEYQQAALIASRRQSLERVSEALTRLDRGTYGICDRCGTAIPAERLELLPHARYCVPCQEKVGS